MKDILFKNSTLKERELFYKREFNIKRVNSWFTQIRKILKIKQWPQFYSIDPGSETRIIHDKKEINTIIDFYPNISLKELKYKLIKYKPEDVYYDRNIYKDVSICLKKGFNFNKAIETENWLGQELAFDIDPENINCPDCGKKKFPKFCSTCLKISLLNGLKIKDILQNNFNFKNIKLVYSGRGCHVHVLDKKAFSFSVKERERYNKKFLKFAIDPWVSGGKIRLIRLPYSLNSLVSRIATPVNKKEIKSFNHKNKKYIPNFLK